jgi:hypothetical protein
MISDEMKPSRLPSIGEMNHFEPLGTSLPMSSVHPRQQNANTSATPLAVRFSNIVVISLSHFSEGSLESRDLGPRIFGCSIELAGSGKSGDEL